MDMELVTLQRKLVSVNSWW